MTEAITNIGWAIAFSIIGGAVGIGMVLLALALLPRALNRLTPHVDEEMEIARGNAAVGEYFGRVVAAGILGVSIIIAAAILGGLIAALH